MLIFMGRLEKVCLGAGIVGMLIIEGVLQGSQILDSDAREIGARIFLDVVVEGVGVVGIVYFVI